MSRKEGFQYGQEILQPTYNASIDPPVIRRGSHYDFSQYGHREIRGKPIPSQLSEMTIPNRGSLAEVKGVMGKQNHSYNNQQTLNQNSGYSRTQKRVDQGSFVNSVNGCNRNNHRKSFNNDRLYPQSQSQPKLQETTAGTTVSSKSNLHHHQLPLLKLESKALELYKKIEHQMFQISFLTEETESLMRRCDDQKMQINSVGLNVEMLQQEYTEEIGRLKEEKISALEMVSDVEQECKSIEEVQSTRIADMRSENEILAEKIEEALKKKQALILGLKQQKQEKELFSRTISIQEDRLDELRFVERKYKIALKDLNDDEKFLARRQAGGCEQRP